MHFDMHLNSNVLEYNKIAAAKLLGKSTNTNTSGVDDATPIVDSSFDMYSLITNVCGQPPYYGSKLAPNVTNHCKLINDNEEYVVRCCRCRLLYTCLVHGKN